MLSSAQEGSNAERISNVFNNSYTVLLSGIAQTVLSGRPYDTSGAYTDADVQFDLSRGLPDVRTKWIKQRDDTEILSGPTSEYARQRERDLLTYHLRFPSPVNTAGCVSAREAVQTACMARELFQTNLIKLEVIGDEIKAHT